MPEFIHARAAINKLFTQVGTPSLPDTMLELSKKNTAAAAWEYAVAEQGRSYWNKRYDNAKTAAKEAGILGSEDDYITGETVVTWSSADFDITAKKAAGSQQVTLTALKNALARHVSKEKAQQILDACVSDRKGAVTISVAMR